MSLCKGFVFVFSLFSVFSSILGFSPPRTLLPTDSALNFNIPPTSNSFYDEPVVFKLSIPRNVRDWTIDVGKQGGTGACASDAIKISLKYGGIPCAPIRGPTLVEDYCQTTFATNSINGAAGTYSYKAEIDSPTNFLLNAVDVYIAISKTSVDQAPLTCAMTFTQVVINTCSDTNQVILANSIGTSFTPTCTTILNVTNLENIPLSSSDGLSQIIEIPISPQTGDVTISVITSAEYYATYGGYNSVASYVQYACTDSSTTAIGGGLTLYKTVCAAPQPGVMFITFDNFGDPFTATANVTVNVCNSTTGGIGCTKSVSDITRLVPSVDSYTISVNSSTHYHLLDIPANLSSIANIYATISSPDRVTTYMTRGRYADFLPLVVVEPPNVVIPANSNFTWVLSAADFYLGGRYYISVTSNSSVTYALYVVATAPVVPSSSSSSSSSTSSSSVSSAGTSASGSATSAGPTATSGSATMNTATSGSQSASRTVTATTATSGSSTPSTSSTGTAQNSSAARISVMTLLALALLFCLF